MARSTATADVKATRHGKRLRQREGALSERHFLKGQLSRTSNACSKGGGDRSPQIRVNWTLRSCVLTQTVISLPQRLQPC